LLICDDIFTTGATADACARVLRQAGAAEVAALTVARG
jgi:predicted amidophosphoribosyltransferase